MPFFLEHVDLATVADGKVGQQARVKTLLDSLDADLDQLAQTRGNPFLTDAEQLSLINGLENLSTAVENSQHLNAAQYRGLGQRLRLFVLLLDQHPQRPLVGAAENKAGGVLANIKLVFGQVPNAINDKHIDLPGDNYLPPMMTTAKGKKTLSNWQGEIWKNPSRRSDDGEKLEFFTRPGENGQPTYAAVRLWLFDNTPSYQSPIANTHAQLFSYPDGDFFERGDLHADHLQSSDSILYRQLEIIRAMNLDPAFRQSVKSQLGDAAFNEYFKEEGGKLYGTKYFFLKFHNCPNNLWLITGNANSGAGKGNEDVLVWIANEPNLGQPFFNSIDGIDKVNQSTLLYSVFSNNSAQNGKLLAQVVKEFLNETQKLQVGHVTGRIKQLDEPHHRAVSSMLQSQSRKRALEFGSAMQAANALIDPDQVHKNKQARFEVYQKDKEILKSAEEAWRSWWHGSQEPILVELASTLEGQFGSPVPSSPPLSWDSQEIMHPLVDLQDQEKRMQIEHHLEDRERVAIQKVVESISVKFTAPSASSQVQDLYKNLAESYRRIYNDHLLVFAEVQALPDGNEKLAAVRFAGLAVARAALDLDKVCGRDLSLKATVDVETQTENVVVAGGNALPGCFF